MAAGDGDRLESGALALSRLHRVGSSSASPVVASCVRTLGCRAAQGYALGRLMPADELEQRLPGWILESAAAA